MNLSALEKRNLALLWLGQFVSRVGDYALNAVVVFLVLSIETERAEAKSGAIWLFHSIPFLVIGLIAGAMVDHWNRRRVMLVSDLLRAGLVGLIPWVYYSSPSSMTWLVVGGAVFLMGICATFFTPARDAMIPELVHPKAPLLRINSLFQTSEQIAMIVGTAFTGLYLGVTRETSVGQVEQMVNLIGLDSLTFLVSFASILLIRYQPRPIEGRSSHRALSVRAQTWADVKAGLRYAYRDPVIRPLLWLTALNNFFIMGPAIVGANFFIKDRLHLGPEYVAYFILAFGVGWLAGTLWIAKQGTRMPKGRMICFGILMDGATMIPFAFVHSFAWLMVLGVFHAFFVSYLMVGRTTLIHENTPRAMHGKLFALINLAVAGFIGISCWLTGEAGVYLDPGTLYLIAGIGGTVCGLVGFAIRPLRTAA